LRGGADVGFSLCRCSASIIPDPGEHRRPASRVTLRNQQQRLHRSLPFVGIVFGHGQLADVEFRIAQRERLADRRSVGPETRS